MTNKRKVVLPLLTKSPCIIYICFNGDFNEGNRMTRANIMLSEYTQTYSKVYARRRACAG